MDSLQNILPEKKSSTSHGELKSLAEFRTKTMDIYNHQRNNLIAEFRHRDQSLRAYAEMKCVELEMLAGIVALNSANNEGKVDPMMIMKVEKELAGISYLQALNSMTLRGWQVELGDARFFGLLCDVLHHFLRQFQVKEMMSGNQIMTLASRLAVVNSQLKVKELIMVLSGALEGKYGVSDSGSHFQRIGIDTVLGWISKFYEESAAALEVEYAKQKPESSQGDPSVWVIPERKLQAYKQDQQAKKAIVDQVWQKENRQATVDANNAKFKEEVKVIKKSKPKKQKV